jgi:universal stress protein A
MAQRARDGRAGSVHEPSVEHFLVARFVKNELGRKDRHMLPKTILVPTDLSDDAKCALDYACELATKLGAKIHLVNVIGIPTLGVPEVGLAVTASTIDSLVVENQRALDALADEVRARAPFGTAILKTGDARDMINEAAKELGADLIVMCTHGRSGVSRLLLGSTAETVVRSAPCPVLTIHAPDAATHKAA